MRRLNIAHMKAAILSFMSRKDKGVASSWGLAVKSIISRRSGRDTPMMIPTPCPFPV